MSRSTSSNAKAYNRISAVLLVGTIAALVAALFLAVTNNQASAANPKPVATTAIVLEPGWKNLENKLAEMINISSAGDCLYEPTRGMEKKIVSLSRDYNKLSIKLENSMLTPRPFWLPKKAPSLDSMRKWGCYHDKAPHVPMQYQWDWPYQQYLWLLSLAARSCAGLDISGKYSHSAGEYNHHRIDGDYTWPPSLTATAPALGDLKQKFC